MSSERADFVRIAPNRKPSNLLKNLISHHFLNSKYPKNDTEIAELDVLRNQNLVERLTAQKNEELSQFESSLPIFSHESSRDANARESQGKEYRGIERASHFGPSLPQTYHEANQIEESNNISDTQQTEETTTDRLYHLKKYLSTYLPNGGSEKRSHLQDPVPGTSSPSQLQLSSSTSISLGERAVYTPLSSRIKHKPLLSDTQLAQLRSWVYHHQELSFEKHNAFTFAIAKKLSFVFLPNREILSVPELNEELKRATKEVSIPPKIISWAYMVNRSAHIAQLKRIAFSNQNEDFRSLIEGIYWINETLRLNQETNPTWKETILQLDSRTISLRNQALTDALEISKSHPNYRTVGEFIACELAEFLTETK